jgi:hypothetical protein
MGARFSTSDIRFELDRPAWALGALNDLPTHPLGRRRAGYRPAAPASRDRQFVVVRPAAPSLAPTRHHSACRRTGPGDSGGTSLLDVLVLWLVLIYVPARFETTLPGILTYQPDAPWIVIPLLFLAEIWGPVRTIAFGTLYLRERHPRAGAAASTL